MILASKIALKSAKLISDSIYNLSKVRLTYTADPEKICNKLHIRYGNWKVVSVKDTEFNAPGAIAFLANKRRFSDFLAESDFITPQFINWRLPEEKEYPVLIRRTLSGFKGRGIKIAKDEKEFHSKWEEGIYWCKFLKTTSEYRVHILKPTRDTAHIMKIMRKVLRNGYVEANFPVRTLNHYRFSRRLEPDKKYPKMLKEIIDVANILPGRFFSLDVGWSRIFSRPIFFEANTASGLDSASADALAEFFCNQGVI